MPSDGYQTGHSGRRIYYHPTWHVLDIGSGHSPHIRANVLVDKFYFNDRHRAGRPIILPPGKDFVVADVCALPFKDKVFDFVICSHVAEHIQDIDGFCTELNRIARRGYLETPSRLAEILRHSQNHRWYVSKRRGGLVFRPIGEGYPLGWFGKLFFSLIFYRRPQIKGQDVFPFAHGYRKPWHYLLVLVCMGLHNTWRILKPFLFLTKFQWEDEFSWEVKKQSVTSKIGD